MEIVRCGTYTLEHNLCLNLDRAVPGELSNQYRIDRGILDIWQLTRPPFDFFAYLNGLVERSSGELVKVFEGGCGVARALEDLKRGITVLDTSQHFAGLHGKIYTVGITLSDHHADVASHTPEPHRVDKMIVGPIEEQETDETFHFAYDFMGPARYNPEGAIPAYGRLLKPGSMAFLRLNIPNRTSLRLHRALFATNRLAVLRETWPQMIGGIHTGNLFVDVLMRKRETF